MEGPTKHNCKAKRQIPAAADFKQLASWMKKCDREHHHENRKRIPERSLSSIRLIDIRNKCIFEQSLGSMENLEIEYAALSYTWGLGRPFQLTTEVVHELQKPGSLPRFHNKLSKVVTDAMFACERLKIGFLWIDTLCIVHDDPLDKHTQIENMDLVCCEHFLLSKFHSTICRPVEPSFKGFFHSSLTVADLPTCIHYSDCSSGRRCLHWTSTCITS